jgi:hypothetical protein
MFLAWVITILMGPGLLLGWISDKLTGDTSHKGSGALGMAIIVSIVFWAIAIPTALILLI